MEDWKFSDLREIVSKNFKKLDLQHIKTENKNIDLIKDFEHNYIVLINGELKSNNFNFEEKDKIIIQTYLH